MTQILQDARVSILMVINWVNNKMIDIDARSSSLISGLTDFTLPH